jgi:PPM family protein phosphatase
MDPENGMFIIADGLGGRPGGAMASRIAARTFRAEILTFKPANRLKAAVLRQAVAEADKTLRSFSRSNDSFHGMGTTLTATVFDGNSARIVHVGDSRAYLFRNTGLRQVTIDHTLVAELIDRKSLTVEEAKNFRFKNILSQALGGNTEIDPHICGFRLRQGEWLLLATDGLYGALTDRKIEGILKRKQKARPETLCRAVMESALRATPLDNLSFGVVRVCVDK